MNLLFPQDTICKVMVFSTNEVFKKKWFKGFNNVFTKESLRFHKLELLVSRIVRASHKENVMNSDAGFNHVCFAFFGARKFYCAAKLAESLRAKKANIRSAIDRRIESFKVNKSYTIRNVLKHLFCKVMLDHLVVDNKLILEPGLVKFKLDMIMEDWTRKCEVLDNISGDWYYQYQPLEYVFDKAFSGVMCLIEFDKLVDVVFNLPNGKAASLLEGVLTNICPIALIETAHKILSKIFSNKIFLACSTFDVLCGNNFLVLKSMMTQSPIFAVGSVVEDALEKNWKLWLVLQDILVRIKMCSRFIWFFGGIHKDCTNRMMTDFGLMDGYCVHNGLNQREAATQHILDIANEFFWINNISINNNKTVAISINSRISTPFLSISGSPISIVKKGKSHQYLGIFLSIEGLSKPSLAKANSDICFFTNLVLRKTVLDKQFLYLVLVVFYSIVSYRMQFSFVLISICNKWNVLIYKSLKFKFGLPLDFLSNIIHYPFFYGLKSFVQVQSESKVASFVSFANFGGILGHLFSHRSHNLQVLCWHPVHPLSFSVCICFHGGVLMFVVLGKLQFFRFFPSFQWYGIAFVDQLCDHHSSFELFVVFLNSESLSPTCPLVLDNVGSLNILKSQNFVFSTWLSNISIAQEIIAHCSEINSTELQFREATETTIKSLFIIQRTSQPKPSDINTRVLTKHQVMDLLFDLRPQIIISPTNKSTVAESKSIGANHLRFTKFLFQHYCQHLGLNHNQILAESVFNFYVNEKIAYLLRTSVNTESAKETFYHKLIQNTSLSTNYNFASIITEINKEIEHCTQQRYPITYATVTPKQIQPPTKKKTRVESSTNSSYHYTLRSTINITSTGTFTSHDHMACILKDLSSDHQCHQDFNLHHSNQISESQQLLQPPQQPQQLLQQPQQQLQQPNVDPMAYALIAKLEKFTSKENNTQVWLNDMEKAIAANSWNNARAMQVIFYFLQNTANLWYQSLANKLQDFAAFKLAFLQYFSNNNSINRLANTFTTIKQGKNKAADYFTAPQILNQFIRGLHSSILQCIHPMHPVDLQAAINNARDFEAAELKANHAQAINLVMNGSSELDSKLKQFKDTLPNTWKPNQKQPLTNILPATIMEDEFLAVIFPFEIEKPTETSLFSGAILEKKPITVMYTDAKIDSQSIKLILDSRLAGSIITRQLINQLGHQVNQAASAKIITADGATKTPISKINNLPIEINGITVPIKVLVMEATQYQALMSND
ncbi:hypothetical protein G9A89_021536 [Geosiphon pyriformis]|nr:hypothetical protein G9A89_021536 [Geosiphon pyriformis]